MSNSTYLHILTVFLDQSFTDFEIICIDDVSLNSLEILNYFSKNNSLIKNNSKWNNRCPGYSRNHGLENSKVKYISFLDGDYFSSSEVFKISVKKAEKDSLDVVMFKNIVLQGNKKDFGMVPYYDMKFRNCFENRVFNHLDLDKTKLFEIFYASRNKFYLKSFLDDKNIRFPNENLIHEDDPFFHDVIISENRISIFNQNIWDFLRFNDLGCKYD